MDDLSARAADSLWPTGQGTDAVSSPERAMTAPGSPPAAHDILPDRSDLRAPDVTVTDLGDGARHLVRGERP